MVWNFFDASVVSTSFACCTLFQAVSASVFLKAVLVVKLVFQIVSLCFPMVSVDLCWSQDALVLDFGVLVYHPAENIYRCKPLINSKTISVSKKIQFFLQDLLIPKT